MITFKRLMIVCTLCMLMPATSWAVEFIGTGLTGTLEYTEPVENEDGTPLTDLDRTEYRVGNGVDPVGNWVSVPATAPTGGGFISIPDVTIPFPSIPSESTGVIRARACDDAGQRGANSQDNCSVEAETTVEIDTLPPKSVQ